MNKKILFGFVISAITILCACSKKSSPSDEPVVNNFDKTAMLQNYADNLIIPAYTDLQTQLNTLNTAINSFLGNPTEANQQTLKAVFKTAYLSFERVSFSQFGPAETVLLNNFLNTLPAMTNDDSDLVKIESSIQSGTYDLQATATANQQGFPALDYLLFASDAVTQLNDSGSANRKKYIQDVMARMQSLTSGVLTNWKSSYRSQFVANTKSDAGSPIGYMVNQFAYEMDQLKGPRIGWPYGKQSAGVVFETKLEGYYSGISLSLAIENLTNLKRLYVGGSSGNGISAYLIALKKEKLNTDILSYFDNTIAKLKAIPEPLANSLTNNKPAVDAAYKDIQILLTALKTDMASALSVRITYTDNDGD
ncbi:imelysin family protein [Pedobacter endophyticus]|uniref:Imelysin family protein n=1 Tax=Pedobacter endophyticus TaxID=2789740 RepID=A0A7S9KYN2_9SPHI|nr:imelysin family protein [Pedobacter endophyticus]QPH39283.1 imelysin family protein [Pedobacter endophyticus]